MTNRQKFFVTALRSFSAGWILAVSGWVVVCDYMPAPGWFVIG